MAATETAKLVNSHRKCEMAIRSISLADALVEFPASSIILKVLNNLDCKNFLLLR